MRAVSIGPSDDRISDKPLVIARGWHVGAEGDYRAMGLVRGTRSRPLVARGTRYALASLDVNLKQLGVSEPGKAGN